MSINFLSINSLRNIETLSFEPNTRLNIIFGANGSGKTSVLEAIFLLGRGKSFRSARSRNIIKYGEASLTVFGKLSVSADSHHKLGVQILKSGGFSSKVDGKVLKKSSDLVAYVPLLFISPDADKLINSSPRQRRRFLDWGLFHVKHEFLEIWQRYNRILAQRNILLKQGRVNLLSHWDTQLVEAGGCLNDARLSYIAELAKITKHIFEELSGITGLSVTYYSGWPKDTPYEEALKSNIESDIKLGFTQRGPHRCDLKLTIDGKVAAGFLSGGQQKILASSLLLAQANIFNKSSTSSCVLLVDDLPSELDQTHRDRFVKLLYETESQLFVTTTAPEFLDYKRYEQYSMFHVEHGVLTPK